MRDSNGASTRRSHRATWRQRAAGRVKELLWDLGWDLRRAKHSPRRDWCGLRAIEFAQIIDVGANKGQFARLARAAWPQTRIVCFEPLPGPFARLSDWANTRAAAGMVTCFPLALGERAGQLPINEHVDHDPSSSLLATTTTCESLFSQTSRQQQTTVNVASLDDLVEAGQVPNPPGPVLVKLDVQGYEDRVIAGARATLSRAEACIVEINILPLYEGQATFSLLHASLSDLGLRFAGALEQTLDHAGSVIFMDAVFRR